MFDDIKKELANCKNYKSDVEKAEYLEKELNKERALRQQELERIIPLLGDVKRRYEDKMKAYSKKQETDSKENQNSNTSGWGESNGQSNNDWNQSSSNKSAKKRKDAKKQEDDSKENQDSNTSGWGESNNDWNVSSRGVKFDDAKTAQNLAENVAESGENDGGWGESAKNDDGAWGESGKNDGGGWGESENNNGGGWGESGQNNGGWGEQSGASGSASNQSPKEAPTTQKSTGAKDTKSLKEAPTSKKIAAVKDIKSPKKGQTNQKTTSVKDIQSPKEEPTTQETNAAKDIQSKDDLLTVKLEKRMLQISYDKLKQENERLAEECSEYKKKLHISKDEQVRMNITLRGAIQDKLTAEEEIQKLEARREQLQKEIDKYSIRNQRLEHDVERLKSLNEKLRNGCLMVESQAKAFEDRHETIASTKSALEEQLISIKEEASNHLTTIAQLRDANDKLTRAVYEGLEEHAKMREELLEMRRQHDTRLEKYKLDNHRAHETNNQLRKFIERIIPSK